jgi:hypothetical protein
MKNKIKPVLTKASDVSSIALRRLYSTEKQREQRASSPLAML